LITDFHTGTALVSKNSPVVQVTRKARLKSQTQLRMAGGLNRRIDPLPPDNAFSPAMTDDLSRRVGQPTHEALWPADLFTQGIGWVIIARLKSEGARVQAGIFLIDVFCLGAKLAVYEDCDGDDYRRRIRDHYLSSFPMVATEPWCARKLVEQAVQYAQDLWFAPAARVFGGLRAEQCSQKFTFGHKGKPLYLRGPRETEEQACGIVWHLQQRCGPGNFEYLVMLGEVSDIDRSSAAAKGRLPVRRPLGSRGGRTKPFMSLRTVRRGSFLCTCPKILTFTGPRRCRLRSASAC
jgi:hypothetical protein